MITKKDEKKAIYGAIQRLLNKISEDYPYTSEDFGFEVGYCPERFNLSLGLSPNIMHFSEDYTNFKEDLGDYLLQLLLESDKIYDVNIMQEKLFADEIDFDAGESNERS